MLACHEIDRHLVIEDSTDANAEAQMKTIEQIVVEFAKNFRLFPEEFKPPKLLANFATRVMELDRQFIGGARALVGSATFETLE